MIDFTKPFALQSARAARSLNQGMPFDFSPEEEASLLRQIGQGTLGGLAWIGETLDKPGAAVRGVLAGEFDQLLNLIPFSDTLGITRPEDRVYGRELLEKAGILGKNKKGFDSGDVAGFGADVLLDPLTYLTFGASAAGKAGKLAQQAGLWRALPQAAKAAKMGPRAYRVQKTTRDLIGSMQPGSRAGAFEAFEAAAKGADKGADVAKLLDQPLGHAMGVGLPFLKDTTKGFGQAGGQLAKVAGAMDFVGGKIRGSRPVSYLASKFDSSLHGTLDPMLQQSAKMLDPAIAKRTALYEQTIDDLARMQRTWINRALAKGGDKAALADDLGDRLFDLGEATADELPGTVKSLLKDSKLEGLVSPDELLGWRETYKALDARLLDDGKALGVNPRQYRSNVMEHMARRNSAGVQRDVAKGQITREFGTGQGAKQGRKPVIRELKTTLIRRIAKDPEIEEAIEGTAEELGETLRKLYPDELPETYVKDPKEADKLLAKLAEATDPEDIARLTADLEKLNKPLAPALAKWLQRQPAESRAVGIFGNDPLLDLQVAARAGARAIEKADWVTHQLGKEGVTDIFPIGKAGKAPTQEGYRPLIGKKSTKSTPGAVLSDLGIKHKQPETLEKLHKRFFPDSEAGNAKSMLDELRGVQVKSRYADDLVRESAKPITGGGAVTSFINYWKAVHTGTITRPAFHSRNFVSGMVKNFLDGSFSPRSIKATWQLTRGGTVKGDFLLKNPAIKAEAARLGIKQLGEAEATDIARELIRRSEVVGKYESQAIERVGMAEVGGRSLDDLSRTYPGGIQGHGDRVSGKRIFRKAIGGNREPGYAWKNIKQVRGVGDVEHTTFAPIAAGEELGKGVEDMLRISPWLELTARGVDPGEAARMVSWSQVSYRNAAYTSFEQALKRFGFPFYSFMKGSTQHTVKELLQRPGGRLGQLIRGTNALRGDEVVPEHISQGLAIPVGSGPSGDPRYITGMGLMHEDALPGFFGGGIRGAAGEAIGRLNPLLKFPIETAANKSFFQRGPSGARDLDALDPLLGRIVQRVGKMTGLRDSNQAAQILPTRGQTRFAEQVAANVAGGPLSQVRTAIDDRKGIGTKILNLGTGMRVSDVPERARDAQVREVLSEMILDAGGRKFSKAYHSKAEIAKMPPHLREQALQRNAINAKLSAAAKERAKAAQAGVGGSGAVR